MPAHLQIEKIAEENGISIIEVKLFDKNKVQCLDASNWIRFAIAGDGKLIDNQGTSTGSRYLQMYNGRALIKVQTKGGKSAMSAKVEGVETVFISL